MQPTIRNITRQFAYLGALAAVLLATACSAPTVSDVAESVGTVRLDATALRGTTVAGTVLDIKGETLPGVAVTCVETGDQMITGPVGSYRVRFEPGPVTITFIKSGYTPGILELESGDASTLEANPVRLYRLPVDSGVYFFEDLAYRPVDSILPERFVATEPPLGAIYGTRRRTVSTTEDRLPTIIGFRVPRGGASLYRLRSLDMMVTGPRDQPIPVDGWVPAHAVAVEMAPIDEPDGLLRVLQLEEELEPGRYALHWGALDGDRDLDQRAFVFEIVEPDSGVIGEDIVEDEEAPNGEA